MITVLGKLLRVMRIEKGELLKDMARKLNISSAYLSSIENGKRQPVKDFVAKISKIYCLSQTEEENLIEAYYATIKEVTIKLSSASNEQANLSMVFARKVNDLDDTQIEDLFNILSRGRKGC